MVAAVERFERAVVAAAHPRDQLLVDGPSTVGASTVSSKALPSTLVPLPFQRELPYRPKLSRLAWRETNINVQLTRIARF